MTNGYYPDRWLHDRRVLGLGDAAHTVFVIANTWSVHNRTDGILTDADLETFPVRVTKAKIDRLLASGLWARNGTGYRITVYEVQTSAAELEQREQRRINERNRKRAERAAAKRGATLFDACPQDSPSDGPQDSPKDSPADVSYSYSYPYSSLTSTSDNGRARAGFSDFWAVYPRHTARANAEKSWERATRTVPAEVIIAGAQRYRDDPNRVDQFTAMPATWLNQGRWDDDPLPPRGGPPSRPEDEEGPPPWQS